MRPGRKDPRKRLYIATAHIEKAAFAKMGNILLILRAEDFVDHKNLHPSGYIKITSYFHRVFEQGQSGLVKFPNGVIVVFGIIRMGFAQINQGAVR